MMEIKAHPAIKASDLAPDDNAPVAQTKVLLGADRAWGQTEAQVINTMQKQGWSILCPCDTFTLTMIGAVMIGKLSRHSN